MVQSLLLRHGYRKIYSYLGYIVARITVRMIHCLVAWLIEGLQVVRLKLRYASAASKKIQGHDMWGSKLCLTSAKLRGGYDNKKML